MRYLILRLYNVIMIYTLTINPSVDLVMDLKAPLTFGVINRSGHEEYNIGGKGINVATVLNNLGEDVTPVTILAGFTGREIESYLKENFKQYRALYLEEGFTRFTLNLRNETGETSVNGNGPLLTPEILDKVIEILKNEMQEGDFLCVSGSVPSSLGEHAYEKIMEALKDKKVDIAIDASKNLMLNTLKYHPVVIKPNLEELGEYFGVELKSKEEGIPYLHKMQEMGARNIICSLGGDGAMLLGENGQMYFSDAPKGKLVNSVGAGDSMVAGFLFEYARSHDYEKALKMGIACGSASAFSLRLATAEQIYDLLKQIQ